MQACDQVYNRVLKEGELSPGNSSKSYTIISLGSSISPHVDVAGCHSGTVTPPQATSPRFLQFRSQKFFKLPRYP